MSLQGPLIVVADDPTPALTERLAAAGAMPVVEARRREVAAAVAAIRPAAIILVDGALPDHALGDALKAVVAAPGVFTPIIACVPEGTAPAFGEALPVAAAATPERLVARLRSALRVRTLHSAVLRRVDALKNEGAVVSNMTTADPLDD